MCSNLVICHKESYVAWSIQSDLSPECHTRRKACVLKLHRTRLHHIRSFKDREPVRASIARLDCAGGKQIARRSRLTGPHHPQVHWSRAARTDKGVHALGNLISVKLLWPADVDLVAEVNKKLPADVCVLDMKKVTKVREAVGRQGKAQDARGASPYDRRWRTLALWLTR